MRLKRASKYQKLKCLELLEGIRDYLPTGYAPLVIKALEREGKQYNERQVYEVMQKKTYHIDIAVNLKKLAEDHKQNLDALVGS